MTDSAPSSLEREPKSNEIGDESLLADLRRVADDLDRSPSMADVDRHGAYSASTYQSRFGSWNEAKEAAGLSTDSGPEFSAERLRDDLNAFADELGNAPSKAEMRESGPHSPSTYVERFGSWTDALRRAGLTPRAETTPVPESDLLDDLRRVADELGRRPTSEDIDERGAYSASTYYRRFDSWQAALEAAGVADEYEDPSAEHLSDEDLLDEIGRMADVLGRPPTYGEMDELGAHSPSTYRRRFGSWREAVREAGFSTEPISGGAKRRIPERELLDELRRLADEYGRPPTYEELQADGRFAGATYLSRFGSWNEALEAAGLESRLFRGDRIPTRELIRKLRALAVRVGRRPYRKEMDDEGPYSGTTYYDRFGGWQDALDAAGIESRDSETVVVGRCDVCAAAVRRPVTDLPDDGDLLCGDRCRSIRSQPTVSFEADVLGSEDDALGRIAAALHESEEAIARVLYHLRHAVQFLDGEFQSARFDGGTITAEGDRLRISSADADDELLVQRDTVDAIATRVESVTSSLRSPEDLRPARESDVGP